VFSVDPSSDTPLFTDGPFIESKEHLGGFAVVDVADEEAARLWAGRIAVACGWPQEVRRFQAHLELPETSSSTGRSTGVAEAFTGRAGLWGGKTPSRHAPISTKSTIRAGLSAAASSEPARLRCS
jgi:hypothetical protein